uniref:Uncharacterized protein n=1 Tax=Rhizophora mucronata TaxID=61149 RepID=A0A2P2Q4Z7_RHIMU
MNLITKMVSCPNLGMPESIGAYDLVGPTLELVAWNQNDVTTGCEVKRG